MTVLSLHNPTDVSFSQIDQELSKIWQAYGEHAAARATTFNLVIYEPKGGMASVQNTIDAIASQSPCRVISLVTQEGEDEGITAQVAAYCPIQKTRSALVCGEYITLSGTSAAFNRVHPLLSELVIPDLPVFVWWKDTPQLENSLFERLQQLGDRLVLDSAQFEQSAQGLLVTSHLLQHNVAVSDLNWSRLAPWQELAAQAFDAPDRRNAVWDIDGVTIDYERGNNAQAILFLAWLASRLQWQPMRASYEGGDHEVQRIWFTGKEGMEIKAELESIPGDAGTVPGDMIGLRLSSSRQNADACNIFCSEATGCMRMEAAGGAQSYRTHLVTPLTDQSADALLAQQMQRWGQEGLYEESMVVATKVLQMVVASA